MESGVEQEGDRLHHRLQLNCLIHFNAFDVAGHWALETSASQPHIR